MPRVRHSKDNGRLLFSKHGSGVTFWFEKSG